MARVKKYAQVLYIDVGYVVIRIWTVPRDLTRTLPRSHLLSSQNSNLKVLLSKNFTIRKPPYKISQCTSPIVIMLTKREAK